MNKKILWPAAAVFAVILGAWFLRPAGDRAKGSGAPAPTLVSLVAPLRRDVPVVLQANGTVTALSSVDLHPQTVNTIRQVHIREGQFVTKGALMFSLDDRADLANVDKAQAQLVHDQASLQDVERQYRRGQELLAQKFIAQNAVDTLRSQLDAARALIGADAAALAAARVSASYSTIRAPMAGRVGAINVYPGSLVQLTSSLTTITQLDPITVAFTLPESSLADLLAAQRRGPVRVEASLDPAAGETAQALAGTLSFIDNTVDPAAGTIRVKAQFDNRDTRLWPGQYVNTVVTVQTLKNATVIPQAAIISNTRGTFVYAMAANQSAQALPVVRLYAFGLDAAVSGLSGKEQIITEGKQNLKPGAPVRAAALDPALAHAGADAAPAAAASAASRVSKP